MSAVGPATGAVADSDDASFARVFDGAGALMRRAGQVAGAVVRGRCDARETLRLVHDALVDASWTALVGAVLIGGIVGLQGLGYLTRYFATEVFGWAAALSAFRDVGPLLLAFALAARVGTKNAAQVATLAARERIDALCALGLDPHAVVTAPRVVAVVLAALLLYPLSALVILLVAFVFAGVLGGQSLAASAWSVTTYVQPAVLWEGLLRLAAFAAIIGLCTTHAGLSLWQRGDASAAAIGGAVYRGSVLSLTGIVVVNLVASWFGSAG
ncbi:MAG: ABC transporter permease [Deltaproteobacteria bacterium]|nr:ABC transporter permease [Deltaproteobacteria bacterium]